MQEEETAGDPRFWLPKGESVVTPERAAKGDMSVVDYHGENEHIRYAQAHVLNVMNMLYEENILNDQQVYDGRTYEVWRAKARTFFTKELGSYSPVEGAVHGSGEGEYGFVCLVRRMHQRDLSAINEAIDLMGSISQRLLLLTTEADDLRSREVKRARRRYYVRAFAKLSDAMPAVRDEIKRVKERKANNEGPDVWELLREAQIREGMIKKS